MDATGIIFTVVYGSRLAAMATDGLTSDMFKMDNGTIVDGFLISSDLQALLENSQIGAPDGKYVVVSFNLDSLSEIYEIVPLENEVVTIAQDEFIGFTHLAMAKEPFTIPVSEIDVYNAGRKQLLPLEDLAERADFGHPTIVANDNGLDLSIWDDMVNEAAGKPTAPAAPNPTQKRTYDTPYLPRPLYMKMLREKGLLTRQPKKAA